MIKKILVPIDGSETADKALDFALDLAEKYSAHIVLLTVVVPPVSTSVAIDDYLEELHSRHEDILSESVKKAKEKRDFEVFTELK
ncbi:MAG: universal stress protein, partial [Thermoproteota archaeon]